jgi:hypothetical protein
MANGFEGSWDDIWDTRERRTGGHEAPYANDENDAQAHGESPCELAANSDTESSIGHDAQRRTKVTGLRIDALALDACLSVGYSWDALGIGRAFAASVLFLIAITTAGGPGGHLL